MLHVTIPYIIKFCDMIRWWKIKNHTNTSSRNNSIRVFLSMYTSVCDARKNRLRSAENSSESHGKIRFYKPFYNFNKYSKLPYINGFILKVVSSGKFLSIICITTYLYTERCQIGY